MAYDKYTWQTGETITAEKLNHIEDGIADMEGGSSSGDSNGFFVIRTIDYDLDEGTWSRVDKTFSQIADAIQQGMLPVLFIGEGSEIVAVLYFQSTNEEGEVRFRGISHHDITAEFLLVVIDNQNNITKVGREISLTN